jgi:hypothetical protein
MTFYPSQITYEHLLSYQFRAVLRLFRSAFRCVDHPIDQLYVLFTGAGLLRGLVLLVLVSFHSMNAALYCNWYSTNI